MSDAPRLTVVGSANVDYVVSVAALPAPGATVLGGDLLTTMGGKGANQAVAAARLGVPVRFIGAVGRDQAGDAVLTNLRHAGVEVSSVARVAAPTGVALITVDPAGENTIVVAPGANVTLAGPFDCKPGDFVLTQLEIPVAAVTALLESGARVIVNVAPPRDLPTILLARSTAVIANETEAAALDLRTIPVAVVTRGAAGADLYRLGELIARARPPQVDVVDAVGAGDTFCAAFAVRLLAGDDPAVALRYAVVAGALATRAPGAQGSVPTHEEVCAWLARAS